MIISGHVICSVFLEEMVDAGVAGKDYVDRKRSPVFGKTFALNIAIFITTFLDKIQYLTRSKKNLTKLGKISKL